jgi:hypothetical protein
MFSSILIILCTDTADFSSELYLHFIFYVTYKYNCWLGSVLHSGQLPIYTSVVCLPQIVVIAHCFYSKHCNVVAVQVWG